MRVTCHNYIVAIIALIAQVHNNSAQSNILYFEQAPRHSAPHPGSSNPRSLAQRNLECNYPLYEQPPYQLRPEILSSLPPHFVDNFNPPNSFWFAWSDPDIDDFAENLYSKLDNVTPENQLPFMRAEMRSWGMYKYPDFRDFLKQLFVYEEYMIQISKELAQSTLFEKLLAQACPDLPEYIQQEAERIRVLQQQRIVQQNSMQQYRNRCDVAQEIFEEQRPQLEGQIMGWQESNPERIVAYQKTLPQNTVKERYRQYRCPISDAAQVLLRTYGLDAKEYGHITGNAFQQQLMREIVAEVDRAVTLQLPPQQMQPLAHLFLQQGIYALDDARQTNRKGDCITSMRLIELGRTFIDHCKAIAEGVRDAAYESITGLSQIILHPLTTADTIFQASIAAATVVHRFFPLPPDSEESYAAWRLYHQQLTDVGKHWSELAHQWSQIPEQIQIAWEQTPSRNIVKSATQVVAGIPINAFLVNRCLALASALIHHIQPMVVKKLSKLAKKIIPAPAAVIETSAGTFIPVTEQNIVQCAAPSNLPKRTYQKLKLPTSPVTIPHEITIPVTVIHQNILRAGALLGLTEETITKALENFISVPAIEGCSIILNQCIQELEYLPGYCRIIKDTFTESAKSVVPRAKGAFNELRSALKLKKLGYRVLGFGEKEIVAYIPDIITDMYLIECKNVDFIRLLDNMTEFHARVKKLKNQLVRALEAGKAINKKVLFMSKKTIPKGLKEEILNMGIEILEEQ